MTFRLNHLKEVTISTVFFLVLAIPTIGVGIYYYHTFDNEMTNNVFLESQTVASLSAAAMRFKITQLANITTNIAEDPGVESDVASSAWTGAKNDLETLWNSPTYYDIFIDRVIFLNTQGTIEAAYPGVASGTIGTTSPAFQEWQGPILQQGDAWYISNVYVGKNSGADYVELFVPVKNAASQIVGVVASQIYTNSFSEFGKDVDVGSDGFAYFVDRNGNIVTHPKYSSNGPLISYTSVPAVQALIAGQSGYGILYNPVEQIEPVTAYEQVPGIGWGVVAQEPINEAFANRNEILRQIILIILLICLIELFGTYLIFRILTSPQKKSRK